MKKWLLLLFWLIAVSATAEDLKNLIGKTESQLLEVKGNPVSKISAGTKVIMRWRDAVIHIRNGVVVSVTAVKAPELLPVAVSDDKEETLFKCVRQSFWGSGGESEYTFKHYASTDTLQFYIISVQKDKKGAPISMCVISMKSSAIDKFLTAIRQWKLLVGTGATDSREVGNFGGNTLYYKAPSFLALGLSHAGESTLSIMEFDNGTLINPAFLTPYEVDLIVAMLTAWRNGGDFSAIANPR